MERTYYHLDWRELLNRLAADDRMDELFQQLMAMLAGDVEEAFRQMEELGKEMRDQIGFDTAEFDRRLRDTKVISGEPGKRTLTDRGRRALRESSLEKVFGKLRAGGVGEHRLPKAGGRGEWNGEVRPWAAGDASEDLDFTGSWLNHLRAGGEHLEHDDLMVRERENATGAATVLLIDISHSMTLYGEDRITPARQVAMAYAELQRRRFPRDTLDVLLFGDDVRAVPVADLGFITNGPFHTNTCEALRRAAEVLVKRHQPTKRVVMITDGKPTALFKGVGSGRTLMINSGYGLDPEIVTATLNQAARYPRLRLDLTVFMVASDPYLERFVSRLTEVSQGRAFRASLGTLGDQVLKELFRGRRG